MGCPGGMSTFRHIHLVLTCLPKVFLEEDSKGKKDRCAVFGCNNDRLYPREIYSDKPYF